MDQLPPASGGSLLYPPPRNAPDARPQAPLAHARAYLLSDIARFSRLVLGKPLYDYQERPLRAILDSVLRGRGLEFLLVFSRQSGKNEAIAHLLAYLLNLYQRQGGNMVFAAVGDGLGRGQRRLQERLDNPLNRGRWRAAGRPSRLLLGHAAVVFISSHPQTAARGETADHLLVLDELQDQDPIYLEAVFTPMRAARNATAVYLGTVRSRHDALWRKKEDLLRLEQDDGQQRLFWAGPELVIAANPAYGRFLQGQVARYGRFHPIIASEYYLEPLEGSGGLFPPRRLTLMKGEHARQLVPGGDGPFVALLDVGGQDEAATGALAQLDNPARDYTVCTIVQVVRPAGAEEATYLALDVFVAHGARFFDSDGRSPSLAQSVLDYVTGWQVLHLVGDATGVGEGLVDWLAARLGRQRVTAFKFSRSSKAALGASFLSLIEAGRFRYWGDDAAQIGSDGWWFWQQAAHCTYDLPPGGRLEQDLRWSVPAAACLSTPSGRLPVHDDRLISAALVAEFDRLSQDGRLRLGIAESAVIPGQDPLQRMSY